MSKRTYNEAWTYISNSSAEWANVFSRDIMEGLSDLGYKTCILNYDGTEQSRDDNLDRFNSKVKTEEPFAYIDINLKSGLDFSNSLMPKRFSIIGDTPAQHIDSISQAREDTIFGFVDRQQLHIANSIGLNQRKVFLPHGGPKPFKAPLAMKDRDIDILFSGHIYTHPDSQSWNDYRNKLPDIIWKIIKHAAQEVIEQSINAFDAFKSACIKYSFNPNNLSFPSFCTVNVMIERYAETTLRHAVISQLKDLNIHIVGTLMEGDGGLVLPNATTHGEMNFNEIIGLMRRSKIMLNITPKFCNGSHERIWYGMANGCVVLTSFSHFLAETLTHDESICFLPKDLNHLTQYVLGLLKDKLKLDEIAQSAMAIYQKNHTWRERVKIIDDILNTKG